MRAKILDGKTMADTILAVIHDKVAEREVQGKRRPGLAVILVGNDAASAVYVRNKKRACERAGVMSVSHDLPTATTQAEVLALIDTVLMAIMSKICVSHHGSLATSLSQG